MMIGLILGIVVFVVLLQLPSLRTRTTFKRVGLFSVYLFIVGLVLPQHITGLMTFNNYSEVREIRVVNATSKKLDILCMLRKVNSGTWQHAYSAAKLQNSYLVPNDSALLKIDISGSDSVAIMVKTEHEKFAYFEDTYKNSEITDFSQKRRDILIIKDADLLPKNLVIMPKMKYSVLPELSILSLLGLLILVSYFLKKEFESLILKVFIVTLTACGVVFILLKMELALYYLLNVRSFISMY